MKSLTEDEVKTLMRSDAYQNRNNPHHEEIVRKVTQAWENLYPDDDRNEKSTNYYVWKAVGDSKTRSSHAERDGQVFSWDNPPEGGHPGEDYNCRCKAEKYAPAKDKMCPIDGSLHEPVSKENNLLENVQNWNDERKRVARLKISDENKHQYMSCLAGRDGLGMASIGLGMGIGKEIWDLTYKTAIPSVRKRHGGVMGVALDGGKDMVNNIKGLKHGLIDGKPCINLLERKIP